MYKMDKEDRASWTLFIVCFIVYTIISMTKNAYSASIAAIIDEGIFNKSQAGIINSGFYLFYGGAQLLGVKLVDKTSPMILIGISLIGSAITSILMAYCHSFIAMLIIWSLCGLFQFAIWPAVIRILAEYLIPPHRKQAMSYIAFAYCIGMLANYAGASLILNFFNWRTLFLINTVILAVSFIVWTLVSAKTSKTLEEANATYKALRYSEPTDKGNANKPVNVNFFKLMLTSGLFFIMVPAFVRCTLDLGVKSWVPTMIMENYGVSASFATILTTILIITNLFGVFITNFLYPKRVPNAVAALGVIFTASLLPTILLLFVGKIPVAFIVLFLIITTTLMYAGNQILTVIIPSFFSKYNRTGGVAGILNAIASFGAVIASFAFGCLAENYGWNTTITSWIILNAIAMLFCFIAISIWRKFTEK